MHCLIDMYSPSGLCALGHRAYISSNALLPACVITYTCVTGFAKTVPKGARINIHLISITLMHFSETQTTYSAMDDLPPTLLNHKGTLQTLYYP